MDTRSPDTEARTIEVEATPARPAKPVRNRSRTKRSGPATPVQKRAAPQGALTSAFYRVDANTFAGHVTARADLTRRYVVQLFIDGTPASIVVAHEYDHALAEQGVGDGCYGFVFTVPGGALTEGTSVEARLANAGTQVVDPSSLHWPDQSCQLPFTPCGVRWIGGLRFSGWMSEAANGAGKVTAVID